MDNMQVLLTMPITNNSWRFNPNMQYTPMKTMAFVIEMKFFFLEILFFKNIIFLILCTFIFHFKFWFFFFVLNDFFSISCTLIFRLNFFCFIFVLHDFSSISCIFISCFKILLSLSCFKLIFFYFLYFYFSF
jgi:hypothetical protein